MDRLMRVPVVVLVALACAVVPGAARGDGNTIREVKARADGARTVVTVRGEATPSFTVYRLEQPARLVVDLAGARLASGDGAIPGDGPLEVDTWAVGQIAFAQYSSSTLRTARVMIGLKRAVTYDVKAQGKDLIVTITPDELPPPGALESARAAEEAQRARIGEEQRRKEAEQARQRAEADAAAARAARDQAQTELERLAGERARAEKALEAARTAESHGVAMNKEIADREAALARVRAEQAQAAERARTQEAELQRRLAAVRAETEGASRARDVEEQRRKEAEAARQRAEGEALAARAARDQAQAELTRLADERARAEKALERARAVEHRGAAVEKEIAEREVALARVRAQQSEAGERARAQEDELQRRLAAVRAETDKLARVRDQEQRRLETLRAERDKLTAESTAARAAEAQRAQQATAARTVEEERRRQAELARQQAEAQAVAAQAERDKAQAELSRLATAQAQAERSLAALRSVENRTAAVEQEIAQREAALARTRAEQAQAAERARKQEAEVSARLAAVRAETENLARARAAEEQRAQQATAARTVEEQRLRQAEAARQKAEAEAARARAARDQAQAELARLADERAGAEKALAAARTADQAAAARTAARDAKGDAREVKSREAALAQLQAQQEQAAARARAQEAELSSRLAAVRAETENLARARALEEQRQRQAAAARGQEEEKREQAELARQRAEKEAAAARAARDQAQAELARLVEERARAEKALAAARRDSSRGEAADVAAREAALADARARQAQAEGKARSQEAELSARLAAVRAETAKLSAARDAEQRQLEAMRAERDRLAAETARLSEERARSAEAVRQAAPARAAAQRGRDEAARQAAADAQRSRDEAARQAAADAQRGRDEAARQAAADAQRGRDEAARQAAADAQRSRDEAARAAATATAAARPAPEAPPARPDRNDRNDRRPEGRDKVATASAGPARARVTSVDFRDEDRVARVVIGLSGEADFTQVKAPVTVGPGAALGTATLRIRSTVLPPQLARTLDTSAFGGPVAAISTYADPEDPGAVRVVVKLGANVDPEVRRERGRIVWDFPKATVTGSFPPPRMAGFNLNTLPLQVNDPTAPLPVAAPPQGGPGRPLGGARRRFSGAPVNLDLKDVDIHNLLRLLSEVGNVNIITSDDVKGTVTIRMKDTPWDQALDVILRQKQLGSVREGNIIRVAPQAVLERERESEVAQTKIIKELLPLETRLVPLSYATADKLLPRVQDLLSPRGKVSVDERTNTLIITDIAGNLALARDLISNLDTQTPQVLIEARIVEAQTNFLRDIGIQWGGSGLTSTQNGYGGTGLNFPSTIGVAGGNVDQLAKTDGLYLNGQQGPVSQSPNYVVNLPAAVGTGSGGALGLTFGSLNGAVNVNLRLSAAESTGNVRILSAPKITTLDNVQAVIEQGTSIPISVVSAAGVNTVFVDAKLNLTVKPHVTHEGSIVMYLEITRNEPDFSRTGARGDPTLLKRQAKTEMLVRDGDTAVIGGIYTRNTSTNYAKIPWLGDIPILGWLFKQRKESDQRSELLIFITPRIVNRAASITPR